MAFVKSVYLCGKLVVESAKLGLRIVILLAGSGAVGKETFLSGHFISLMLYLGAESRHLCRYIGSRGLGCLLFGENLHALQCKQRSVNLRYEASGRNAVALFGGDGEYLAGGFGGEGHGCGLEYSRGIIFGSFGARSKEESGSEEKI